MKKFLLLLLIISGLWSTAAGQISVTSGLVGTAIVENFTATVASPSTYPIPGGFKMQRSGTPTWTGATAGTFGSTADWVVSNTGSPTPGGLYAFRSGTNSDMAIGAMTSSGFSSPNSILVAYTNNSGADITSWSGSFDIERYRINTAAASIEVYVSTNGSSWGSAIATFNSTSDVSVFGTGSSTYGRPQASITGKTFSSTTTIANGSTIYFRVNILTTGSNSQAICIDNWSMTPNASASPTLTFATNPLTVPTTTTGTAGTTATSNVTTTGTSGNFTYGTIPASVLMEYSTNTGTSWTAMTNAGGTVPVTMDRIRASFRSTATSSLSATDVAFSGGGLASTVNLSISGTVQGKIDFSPTSITVPTTTAGTAGAYASSNLTITAATGNITIGGIPTSVDMQYSTNAGSSWTTGTNGGTMPNTVNSVQVRFKNTASAGTLSSTNLTFSGGGLSGTYNLPISGTVDPAPGPQAPTSPSATVVCRSGTSTITFAAPSGATSTRLYDAPTSGILVASGTTTSITTPSISSTTTYYIAGFDGTIESATRTSVTVNVNSGLTSSLTASANNGVAFSYVPTSSGSPTFSWVRGTLPSGVTVTAGSASGTGTINQTFTNTSGANQVVNFTVTTTSGTCNGDAQTVAVTVSGTPAAPSSPTAPAVCKSGTSTITFTAGAGATSTRLYANSSGGLHLATGTTTSITSPSISATTIYYIASVSGSLESATRTAVTVTVNNPTLSSATSVTAPNGSSFTYSPTSSSSSPSYAWTVGALPSGVTSSNSSTSGTGSYTTTFTNANTTARNVTLTYTVTSAGCTGDPVAVTISIDGGTVFYSKTGATDFNDPNSWAENSDGTGASPASLGNDYTLVVRTGASMITSAARTLKSISVQEGATLRIDHDIDVTGSGSSINIQGTLRHNTTANPLSSTNQYLQAASITFGDNSTWEFLQYPSTITWPSGLTSVGSVKFLGSGPVGSRQFSMPNNLVFHGDFELNYTGTGLVRLSASSIRTFTFESDLNIIAGELEFSNDPDGNFTVNLQKDLYIGTAGTLGVNFGASLGSNLNFVGTEPATITALGTIGTGTNDIFNVVIAAGKTITFGSDWENRGNFTVNGTLNMGSFLLENTPDPTVSGDPIPQVFTVGATGKVITTHPNGLRNTATTSAIRVENITLNSACTIRVEGTSDSQLGFGAMSADTPIGRLEIAKTNSAVARLDNDIVVNGLVIVETGATLRIPDAENIKRGTAGTVQVDGLVRIEDADGFAGTTSSGAGFTNYTSPSQFTFGVGAEVAYTGATQTVSSYTNYPTLTVSASGTKSLNGSIVVDGNLNVTAGTLAVGANTIDVKGSLTGGGSFTMAAGGTTIISGTSAQAVWPWAITTPGNLTISRPNGCILGGNLSLTGILTLGGGGLSIGANSLTIGGDVAGTGPLVGGNTSILRIEGGSANTMSGFVRPSILNTLIVNPFTARSFEVNASTSITEALNIGTQGTVTIPSSGLVTFTGNSFVAGSGAALTGGTLSRFTIFATVSQITWPSALSSVSTVDLEINSLSGATLASSANLSVRKLILTAGTMGTQGGTLTVNDGLEGTSGTLTSTGNSKLVLNGTSTYGINVSSGTFNQLTINGGSHFLAANMGITGSSNGIFINDGVLNSGLFDLGGTSSNLTMTGGTLQLGKLGTTLPIDYTSTSLIGGVINLNGLGDQVLRGTSTYHDVTFSGSGVKTLSSSITGTSKVTGTVTVNGVVLDVENNAAFGSYSDATNTNLTMTNGEFRSSNTTAPVPNATGTYTMSGTATVTLYGTTNNTSQTLRGGRTYRNVNISSSSGNYGASGNVVQGSGTVTVTGTMSILSPAVYASSDPISGTGTFLVNTGAGFFYGDVNGITPSSTGTGTSAGAVRTATRTFSSGSVYGVRSSLSGQVTGAGLPASITQFHIHKTGGSVQFSSATTITESLYLFGNNPAVTVDAANATLANGSTIYRTGATLSTAPTFAGVVNLSYLNETGSITTGLEVPTATNVINDFQVSRSAGVIANTSFTVNNVLRFFSGNLITGANTVRLSNTGSLEFESNIRRLVGNLESVRTVGTSASNFGNIGYTIQAGAENLGTVTVLRKTGAGMAATGLGNSGINCVYDVTITGTQPSSGRRIDLEWLSVDDNGKDFVNRPATVFRRENSSSPWLRLRLGNVWNPVQIDGDKRKIYSLTYHFSEYTATDDLNPLPVQLLSFTGKATDKGSVLTWTTAQEINNAGFTLERSWDGEVFEAVTYLKGQGTISKTNKYQYHDAAFRDKAYYRLIQHDLDGTREVFQTILVTDKSASETALKLYPNPAKGLVHLNLSTSEAVVNTTVVDASGRVVYNAAGMPAFLNTEALAAGLYTVSTTLADGTQYRERLVVE